jgi:hypothetical protein
MLERHLAGLDDSPQKPFRQESGVLAQTDRQKQRNRLFDAVSAVLATDHEFDQGGARGS